MHAHVIVVAGLLGSLRLSKVKQQAVKQYKNSALLEQQDFLLKARLFVEQQ